MAPITSFSPGSEALAVDAAEYRSSLEIPEGEDLDLLQRLLTNMVVEPETTPIFAKGNPQSRSVIRPLQIILPRFQSNITSIQ